MKLTFLGTGTSTGIPQIGCQCPTCTSIDIRDHRLRASALLEVAGRHLLIDSSPDFREQILSQGSPRLDALLVTHEHYDHVGGIDDLRPYCYRANGFPVYCSLHTDRALHKRLPYCFAVDHYPGAPTFKMHTVTAGVPFSAEGVEVMPIEVMHGKLPILGFRIGKLAYITDCKTLPQKSLEHLRDVDTLVINALRHEPHHAHMNLEEAIDVINTVNPRRAYLTHLSHDMGLHAVTQLSLPEHISIATDGMTIDIAD